MDPKKQALSPELKEVYDRVMNTQAKPTGQAPAPQAAQATPSTPPAASMPPAAPTVPQPPIQGVVPPPPPSPVIAPKPDGQVPPTLGNISAPQAPAGAPAAAPAPASGPTAFVFNGGKTNTPGANVKAGSKKIPPFLIPVGILVLIVAWAILWAFVFKLI